MFNRAFLALLLLSVLAAACVHNPEPEETGKVGLADGHTTPAQSDYSNPGKAHDLPPAENFKARAAADDPDIQSLIDQLVELGDPDVGMSASVSGYGFAPVEGSGSFYVGVLMNSHGFKTHPAFKELVELGPKAIPYLLEGLSDDRDTQLRLGGGIIGGLWGEDFVSTNDENEREVEIIRAEQDAKSAKEKGNESEFDRGFRSLDIPLEGNGHFNRVYRVKVGDVCFTILGQIVNRWYLAGRYIPSGNLGVTSPVHFPVVARTVRQIWDSEDLEEALFESLKFDLLHESEHGYHQPGAAMRLAYYFPERAVEPIRLAFESALKREYPHWGVNLARALNFSTDPGIQAELERRACETKNVDFVVAALPALVRSYPQHIVDCFKWRRSEGDAGRKVPAVGAIPDYRDLVFCSAESSHPGIQQELTGLMKTTEDFDVLMRCIPVGARFEREAALQRLTGALSKVPAEERVYEQGFQVLLLAMKEFPEVARDMFESYLLSPTVQRCMTACSLLGQPECDFWREAISRFLGSTAVGNELACTTKPTHIGARVEYARVCDVAAHSAARRDSSLVFDIGADKEKRDEMIAAIRKALGD